jgi:hypothetical protein
LNGVKKRRANLERAGRRVAPIAGGETASRFLRKRFFLSNGKTSSAAAFRKTQKRTAPPEKGSAARFF